LHRPNPFRWKSNQKVVTAPTTLGEHLRKRRLELRLRQTDLAARFDVHRVSIQNWERKIAEPAIRLLPKIIGFLGFDPMPEPDGLPNRIAYARRRLGLTQEELATALLVDATTVYRWERGETRPANRILGRFRDLLGEIFAL